MRLVYDTIGPTARKIVDVAYKHEFSVRDLDEAKNSLSHIEELIDSLKQKLQVKEENMKKAEWQYFITTLPKIDLAKDYSEQFSLNGTVWKYEGTKELAVAGVTPEQTKSYMCSREAITMISPSGANQRH